MLGLDFWGQVDEQAYEPESLMLRASVKSSAHVREGRPNISSYVHDRGEAAACIVANKQMS